MKRKNLMLLCLLSTLILSCSSAPEEKKQVQEQPVVQTAPPAPEYEKFETGKVINPVFLKGDSSIAYALYLPTAYTTEKKFPVVYFFDPHAAGHIPVNKYRDLAEKYGYIILGSHNTENGMKMDVTNSVITKMMADVSARMAIDPARVYLCGFSGGSRVASNYAIVNGGINGVIACGAGLGTRKPPVQKFSFLAIAGNEDFNYTELKALDASLNTSDWTHYFLEFDGKHEWPPAEVMNEAFIWLEMDVVRKGGLSQNLKHLLLSDFEIKNVESAIELEKKNKKYEAWIVYKKLLAFTKGVRNDTSTFSWGMKITELEKDPELKKQQERKTKLEAKEDSLKKMYASNLQTKDINWWTAQINQLNKEIKTVKDRDDVLMRKRILSYLSLVAFSSTNGALKIMDIKGAAHFLAIYELVDPTNPEHAYIRARIYAREGQTEKALTHLRKAVNMGFSDLKRLIIDKDLGKLNEMYPEYKELVEKVKENLAGGK